MKKKSTKTSWPGKKKSTDSRVSTSKPTSRRTSKKTTTSRSEAAGRKQQSGGRADASTSGRSEDKPSRGRALTRTKYANQTKDKPSPRPTGRPAGRPSARATGRRDDRAGAYGEERYEQQSYQRKSYSRRDDKDSAEQTSGLLYGINPVTEAIKAGRVTELLIAPGKKNKVDAIIRSAEAKGIRIKQINDAEFFDNMFPKGHQGIAAEATPPPGVTLDELLAIPASKGEKPFFVILDQIEDPRNLGAILRSVDAAGVHGVITQDRRSVGLTPAAIKASAGATEYVPLCTVTNIKNAMARLKEEYITIVGAEADGEKSLFDANINMPVAVVIGSEGKGMRRTVRENCDIVVNLPMRGNINSLNASVAAGVLIFEILRKNSGKADLK